MRSMKNARSLIVTGGALLLLLSSIGCHTQRHEPWNARPYQMACAWPPPCTNTCLDPECYGYEQTCWRPWPGLCSECPTEVPIEVSPDAAFDMLPEEIPSPESEQPATEGIDSGVEPGDAFPAESPSDDSSWSTPWGAEENTAQNAGHQEMSSIRFLTPNVLEHTFRESQFFVSLFPSTDRPLYLSGVWRRDCTADAESGARLLMTSWDPTDSYSAPSSEPPVLSLEHPRIFTPGRRPVTGDGRAIVPTAVWLPMDRM